MKMRKLFLILGVALFLSTATSIVPASAQQIDRTQLPISQSNSSSTMTAAALARAAPDNSLSTDKRLPTAESSTLYPSLSQRMKPRTSARISARQ